MYWEFPLNGGQQSVRMGNWKAIRKDIRKGKLDIFLYNIDNDGAEENNLADSLAEIVGKMRDIMKVSHTNSAIELFEMQAITNISDKWLNILSKT